MQFNPDSYNHEKNGDLKDEILKDEMTFGARSNSDELTFGVGSKIN